MFIEKTIRLLAVSVGVALLLTPSPVLNATLSPIATPTSEVSCDGRGASEDFTDVPDPQGGFITWCTRRHGTCVDFTKDKCDTAYYNVDSLGCKAKHGENFLCCMNEAIADSPCTTHSLFEEQEFKCMDVEVCEKRKGTVLKPKGLCGGKSCRKCCRLLDPNTLVTTNPTQTTLSDEPTTIQHHEKTSGHQSTWTTTTPHQTSSTPPQSQTLVPTQTIPTAKTTTFTTQHPTVFPTHQPTTTSTVGTTRELTAAPTTPLNGATRIDRLFIRNPVFSLVMLLTTLSEIVSCDDIGSEDHFVGLPALLTWCETRKGTCVDHTIGPCITAYYDNDDMGCKARYGDKFWCCMSSIIADGQCTLHEQFEPTKSFECIHVDNCILRGGVVLKAKGLCGGKSCRKCCRLDPPIWDVVPNPLNSSPGMMASMSPPLITSESLTPQITTTPILDLPTPPVGATPTPPWETPLPPSSTPSETTPPTTPVEETTEEAPCFTKEEMDALRKKISSYEGIKFKAYDAKPNDPKVIDWTICVGFNLKRDDARAVFKKVLPGVNFDEVYKETKALTEEQCLALLENDLNDKYIPTAKHVAGAKFCELPLNVRIAIVNAVYRGDLKFSHQTAIHIRNGEWCKVKAEYLNNDEYKNAVKNGMTGVKTRMDWNAEQFQSMCKE